MANTLDDMTIRDWCIKCKAYVSHVMGRGWIKCDECSRHTNTAKKEY